MGEYGMAYREARAVPWSELLALWKASERRRARMELALLDDLYAVAGLQSEVRVEGETPKKGKKVTPVTLNKRRADLERLGYPKKPKPWTPKDERKALRAFWGSVGDDAPTVDLAKPQTED